MAVRVVDVYILVAAVLVCCLVMSVSTDKVVNIAASATCTASIDCQPQDDKCTSCENAIDGNRHSTSWRYVGAAVGVWLQIVFERTYIVSSLVIAMPYWADERHFKDMKLTFTDGSEQTITLTNQNDGWVTETFIIDPPRLSSSVRLSVMSAYDVSSQTRVINEVEIYGKIPEMTTTSGLIETTTPDSTTVTPPATTVTPAPTTPQDRVVNITAKAKCSASFVCQPMEKYCSSCYSAIDGDKSTSWHYRGAAVGVWLQIVFDRSYNVSLVQIAPSYWTAQRHIKDMKLSFSDGGEQTITLSDGSDGWVTESFTIEPPRLSNSLKLSVVSAYDDSETLQNSVNEVGVYGFTRATPDPPQVTATTPSTIGDTKATHQQPNNPWKGRNLFILLGVVGAVLFVVVTLFVVNRRRQSRLPTSNVERGHDTPSSNEEHGYHDATNNEEHVYESTTGNGEHQYENTTSNEQNVYDTLAGNDEHGYETVG
ncbi:hypothetical protein LSAT2_015207 [Lamellibrachia satsuma]|nr:hypothetical protein LSAT2_015207 [Lamellibrachia satsuma]